MDIPYWVIVILAIGYWVLKFSKKKEYKKLKKETESKTKTGIEAIETPVPSRMQFDDFLTYSKVRKIVPDFTVLDLETTGLDPEENDIIQIAAVKYRNFEKVDEFLTFVKPVDEIYR